MCLCLDPTEATGASQPGACPTAWPVSLAKEGERRSSQKAPLTLIGCLVTNCATRIGLRLKETQSWTEGGCELPSKCCGRAQGHVRSSSCPQNHPGLQRRPKGRLGQTHKPHAWDITLPECGQSVAATWDRWWGAAFPAPGLCCCSQRSARGKTTLSGWSSGGKEAGFNSSSFCRAICPFLPIFNNLCKMKGTSEKPKK